MFQKLVKKKFHGKAVQSKTLWLNLNKINEITFFTTTRNPHFRLLRQMGNTGTHALKLLGMSLNSSHLTPITFFSPCKYPVLQHPVHFQL